MTEKNLKEHSKEERTRIQRNPEQQTQQEEIQAPQLSSLVGNRAMIGILSGQPTKSGLSSFIQAKMQLDTPGDAYEVEADQVATATVSAIQRQDKTDATPTMQEEPSVQRISRIQRVGEDEELLQGKMLQRQEDEEETIQAKSEDPYAGKEVHADTESQINNQRGSGSSLDPQTQSQFGSAMGYDLSGVHVHTDATADNLSRSIGAKAFTTGSDVFFSSGTYNPTTTEGQHLLGHELTHVVQQGAASPIKKEGESS